MAEPMDLTGGEIAVLFVLAAEAGPVPNPDLKQLGPELKKESRDKLEALGLIEVTTGARRAKVLALTDKGWSACGELVGRPTPPRMIGAAKTLFVVLRALGRHLDRADIALGEAFLPVAEVAAAPAAAEPDAAEPDDAATTDSPSGLSVRDRILAAYAAETSDGGYVGFVALRARLADIPRPEVDAALAALYPEPGIDLVEDENRKALTAADHAAALPLAGRALHAIRVVNR